ncbi:hypothetical protein [Bdellovibrio sp. HCB2-146]|uniref:hypothetical protein n=1 Tax=Bdellovibrio sp. HCB2-146 TaxID=3394362 RepID=UPI0039BC48DE
MKTIIEVKKIFVTCSVLTLCTACSQVSFTPSPLPDSSLVAPKTQAYTEIVAAGNKQVDFLIVLDDSNSMLPELKKLAARMSSFMNSIESSDIDWQMCLTVTRSVSGAWGQPLAWKNYSPQAGTPVYLLKKGSANLDTIFNDTISQVEIGGSTSGDERAIKATYENFTLGNPDSGSSHGCYRAGAALSVIAISDEDERSVGGNCSLIKSNDAADSCKPLETEDIPANLIAHSKNIFGNDIRFTFNSIIVKPGDKSCEAKQDENASPSHAGYVYSEMSQLTEGGVGSVCDADYNGSLNTFKDKIVNSLNQLALRCLPDPATMKIKINGKSVTNFKVDKKVLKFSQSLIEGTKIDLVYDCQ